MTSKVINVLGKRAGQKARVKRLALRSFFLRKRFFFMIMPFKTKGRMC